MKFIRTNILNPISENKADFLKDAIIELSLSGKIVSVKSYMEYKDIVIEYADYRNCVAIPGLIDMHAHLPQFSAIGIGRGELLDWLVNYIFPLEKKFGNNEFSYNKSKQFFKSAISMGTTSIVTYCSISADATEIAFKTAADTGVRAFIGQSLIDLPNEYGYYSEFDKIKSDLDKLISIYHMSEKGKLKYIVTPRYAGSCSPRLLRYSADIAKQNDLFVQSHLAENKSELDLIKKFHPEYSNYARIYFDNGMMNEKSIYAHCIYLSEEEINLLKNSGAIVCHCPTSNRYLSSGIMSLNEYGNLGIRIAIGSDVGAGYSLSILNEAKEAIENSNIYNIINDIGYSPFCVKKAFYFATRGAAKILYPELNIGLINRDFVADISFFEIDVLDELMTAEDVIRKLFYTKFNQVAELVLINGEIVHGNIKAQ